MTLDGLRGVAAVVVLVYHAVRRMGDDAYRQSSHLYLASSYLAVDLFFILSGFVIAHAYESKLRHGMTPGKFVRIRLIRLYPLYILGCGMSAASVAVAAIHGPLELWRMKKAAIDGLLALIFVPEISDPIFPLNTPAWSLWYEIVINVVYVLVLPQLSTRVLKGVVAVAAVALFADAWYFQTLNLGAVGWRMLGGFPRVGFGFPAGILLYRAWKAGALERTPKLPPLLILGLFLVMMFPAEQGSVIALLAPAIVVFCFPALICLAAVSEPAEGGRLARLFAFGGLLSYPLYATHYALLNWGGMIQREFGAPRVLATSAAALVALPVAWIALKLWDEPVRKGLIRWEGYRRTTVEAAPGL